MRDLNVYSTVQVGVRGYCFLPLIALAELVDQFSHETSFRVRGSSNFVTFYQYNICASDVRKIDVRQHKSIGRSGLGLSVELCAVSRRVVLTRGPGSCCELDYDNCTASSLSSD
jgi:hypothetical protein